MTSSHVEEWAPIPEYTGYYEASSLGQIRSLPRVVNGGRGKRLFPGRIRKQSIGTHGYSVVSLSKEGKVSVQCVNVLVLLAFTFKTGSWPSAPDACHADGNKQNNHLDNLRWDTRAGNMADKKLHGTHMEGSACPIAKLDEAKVREIKVRLAKGEGTTAIGKTFGVSASTINSIKAGKSWKHV